MEEDQPKEESSIETEVVKEDIQVDNESETIIDTNQTETQNVTEEIPVEIDILSTATELQIFPETIPDGVKPMMISMNNMEKYGLKTGPAIKDTVVFKWFDKNEILTEIQNVGFYSDFNDFKKDIAAYPEEKILVIADKAEKYGDNWVICLTVESSQLMDRLMDEERVRLRDLANENAEHEQKAKEEENAKFVYVETPFIANEWKSDSIKATDTEIIWNDVFPSRTLMSMTASRRKGDFHSKLQFADRDADQGGVLEFRQHKNPNYELNRVEFDVGLQACPSWTAKWLKYSPWSNSTQKNDATIPDMFSSEMATTGTTKKTGTGLFEHCHSQLSTESAMTCNEMAQLIDQGSQTFFAQLQNQSAQFEFLASEATQNHAALEKDLVNFLNTVLPIVENAMQQNETFDVLVDEFRALASDEVAGLGDTEESHLKELKTFTDLVYSNGRTLNSVDWHPRFRNVVAVACNEKLHFDQRIESSGMERQSHILVWSFSDLIHPLLVLRSPHECTHFAYNPEQPNIIAAGCATGQVLFWDIRAHMGDAQVHRLAGEDEDNMEEEEKSMKSLVPIQPKSISSIGYSHRRAISDLHWVPVNLHVDENGQVVRDVERVTQFTTCSGDGQIMFWDLRQIEEEKASTASARSKEGDISSVEDWMWKPWYTVSLTNSKFGRHAMNLKKVVLRDYLDIRYTQTVADSAASISGLPEWVTRRSLFAATTADGKIVRGDWLATPTINWQASDSYHGSVSLIRSPFFSFLILSVFQNGFNLWHEDLDSPILSSPMVTGEQHYTTAIWSPTRPGVFFIGKVDGSLEVWDLTDMSHKPIATVPVSPHAVASLKIQTPSSESKRNKHKRPTDTTNKTSLRDKQLDYVSQDIPIGWNDQMLAIGDANGTLRIVELPINMRRRGKQEIMAMNNLIKKELERVEKSIPESSESPEVDDVETKSQPERNISTPNTSRKVLIEESPVDASAEIIEAEERRYQELMMKLLGTI